MAQRPNGISTNDNISQSNEKVKSDMKKRKKVKNND